MSRVFGWEPSQQDENGQLRPSSGQIITFPLSLDSPARDSESPTSKIEDVVLNHRPRKGDPDYVPRPPNSFFIFRHEYSRQNARGPIPKRYRGKSSDINRSMSKRAGEAWKALSKSDRAYFKARAEQVKIEHAQAHPDYRYRPNKSTSTSESCISQVAPNPALPTASDSRFFLDPNTAGNSPRGSKSRSSSVPLHVSAPSPFLLGGEERHIGTLRRSRSHVVQPPLPEASEYQGPEYPGIAETQPFVLERDSEPSADTPTLPVEYPLFTVTTGYSSLAGWNGEPMASPPARVSSPALLTSPLSSWTALPPHNGCFEGGHIDECFGGIKRFGIDHLHMLDSASSAVYWCPQVDQDLKGGYDTSYAYDPMQENALISFNLGLDNEVAAPGGFLHFDTPFGDEQRVYEEYNHALF
ncbi:hypothetical protein J3R30DRAFT_1462619 [Lentinula aciculospora]|uniref:HMG box domain-containing protein n=1 Tax=Lentinula aciculospora TaxID=153920 RepID=A0A9W9DUF6_9AGAR|nr:hypothetical protein J3R30DRAFT_1462619 [Lentinula aciculospora]